MPHSLMPALPVRPVLYPGEDLPSYLQRLARANLVSAHHLGWTRHDSVLRHRETVDLNLVADRLGVPLDDLVPLTVFGYGSAVTGRTLPGAQRTGWRVHLQRRRCPDCPPGHHKVDWDLALHLTCRTHHQLLTPPDWPHRLDPVPDGDALHHHAYQISAALERPNEPATRARLRLAHRLARLTSYTADHTWPPLASPHLAQLATTHPWVGTDLPWTTNRAPQHPIALASLVASAWRATGSSVQTRDLAGEAWARLDSANQHLSRGTVRSLPPRPRPSRARPQKTTTVSATQAAHQLRSLGLHTRHIPLLLTTHPGYLDDPALLPPSHLLPERHDLARLLICLLEHPSAPDATQDLPPRAALRVGHTPNDSSLSELRLTGRICVETLHLLKTTVRGLALHRVDYQERRVLLAGLTQVPVRLLPDHHRASTGHRSLAAGWIWAHLTRGPLVRSLHPFSNADLSGFDRDLDPEHRLALHEYGHSLLTETLDLVRDTARAPALTGTADRLTDRQDVG